jgi:hypothetical protein
LFRLRGIVFASTKISSLQQLHSLDVNMES